MIEDGNGNIVITPEIDGWLAQAESIIGYKPATLCTKILKYASKANANNQELRSALFDLVLKHLHFGEDTSRMVAAAYVDGYIAAKLEGQT